MRFCDRSERRRSDGVPSRGAFSAPLEGWLLLKLSRTAPSCEVAILADGVLFASCVCDPVVRYAAQASVRPW